MARHVESDTAFHRLWKKKFKTQAAFAEAIGYSEGHISEVTAGKMGTSRRFVAAAAIALGRKPADVQRALRATRAA